MLPMELIKPRTSSGTVLVLTGGANSAVYIPAPRNISLPAPLEQRKGVVLDDMFLGAQLSEREKANCSTGKIMSRGMCPKTIPHIGKERCP